jgi:hypothetical protein
LTELGLAWHALEAAIAIAAGVTAGSVALVGFGADSVIEAGAGLVVLWLVTGERLSSHSAERRAQQLIAGRRCSAPTSQPRCSSACPRTLWVDGGGPTQWSRS